MSIYGKTKGTEIEKQIAQLAAGEAMVARCITHLRASPRASASMK